VLRHAKACERDLKRSRCSYRLGNKAMLPEEFPIAAAKLPLEPDDDAG
jgi:hypothetical protein